MNEKELKTSPKQRVFIILIAVIMVGSIIASYAAIVLAGGASSATSTVDSAKISEEKKAEYEEAYSKKVAEFEAATKSDYDKFIKYKSKIAAYNETTANDGGVLVEDLKTGSGKTLENGDSEYLAY